MAQLEQIKDGIRKFESLQTTFASQGAGDTEPDAVFQFLLKQAFTGADVVVPSTVRGWELYHGVPGSEKAAEAMHDCASNLVAMLRNCKVKGNCKVKDLREIHEFLQDYCWRSPFSFS